MKARWAVAGLSLALAASVTGACVDESSSEDAATAGTAGDGAQAEGIGGGAGTTPDGVGGTAGSGAAGAAGGGAAGAEASAGASAGGVSDPGTGGTSVAGGGGSAGTATSDAGGAGASSDAGRGGAGGGAGASSSAGRGGDAGAAQTAGAGGDAGASGRGDGGSTQLESCQQGTACSPEGATCTVPVIWCEAHAWDQGCVCDGGFWLCATGGIPDDCHECCQEAHDENWFCVWGQCLQATACTATDCCVPGPDGDAYCAGESGDCSTCQVNSDETGGVCTPTAC